MNPAQALSTALILTKVEMIGYSVNKDGEIEGRIDKMKLQVNPNSVKHSFSEGGSSDEEHSKYNQGETAVGSPVPTSKSHVAKKETFSFSFKLDATGVIAGCTDVKESLKKFQEISFFYDSDSHRRPVVNLIWGDLFKSGETNSLVDLELTSLTINYTLFKPSGAPLRADVDVTFSQYVFPKRALTVANGHSPDMTHIRKVTLGDTLPAMCRTIYGDARYYLEVARYNNLNSILNITPGQELYFPPLEK